jgi:hypothetical protein
MEEGEPIYGKGGAWRRAALLVVLNKEMPASYSLISSQRVSKLFVF